MSWELTGDMRRLLYSSAVALLASFGAEISVDADEDDPANYDFALTDILVRNLVVHGVEPSGV